VISWKINFGPSCNSLFLLILLIALYCFLKVSPNSAHNSYLIQEIIDAYASEASTTPKYFSFSAVLPYIFPIWSEDYFSSVSWFLNLIRAAAAGVIFWAFSKLQLGRCLACALCLAWILITAKSIASGNYGLASITEMNLAILLLSFAFASQDSAPSKSVTAKILIIMTSFLLLVVAPIVGIVWFPLVLMYLAISVTSKIAKLGTVLISLIFLTAAALILHVTGQLPTVFDLFLHTKEENALVSALKFSFLALPVPLIITIFYPVLALRFELNRILGFSLTFIAHILALVFLPDLEGSVLALGSNLVVVQSLCLFVLYLFATWFKDSRLNQFSTIRILLALVLLLPASLSLISNATSNSLRSANHLAKAESEILIAALPTNSIFVNTSLRTASSLKYEQKILGKREDLTILDAFEPHRSAPDRPIYSYLDLKLPATHVLYSAGIAWQVLKADKTVSRREIEMNFLRVCPFYRFNLPQTSASKSSLELTDVFQAPLVQVFGSDYSTAELNLLEYIVKKMESEPNELRALCLELARSYKIDSLPQLPVTSYLSK
jgi:hypothetical protein